MSKIKEEVFYVCKFCDSVFDSYEMAEIHVGECLQNYEDVHSCVTCKHCEINLVAPTDKDNGYKSLRLQGVVGTKAYLSCNKGIYGGKMSEDKILRLDKDCYDEMEEGSSFIVKKSASYKRYKQLEKQADIEQKDIDDSIKEYWEYIKELDEEGYTKEEIVELVKEKYADYDEEH